MQGVLYILSALEGAKERTSRRLKPSANINRISFSVRTYLSIASRSFVYQALALDSHSAVKGAFEMDCLLAIGINTSGRRVKLGH
jgi:hypothetical protein